MKRVSRLGWALDEMIRRAPFDYLVNAPGCTFTFWFSVAGSALYDQLQVAHDKALEAINCSEDDSS
jgi:hypothetical protein